MQEDRLKILTLARHYPNPVLPYAGLWVQRLVSFLAGHCAIKVVSPVPYCPPGIPYEAYARFRRTPARTEDGSVEVFYPHFLVGPGLTLYALEALSYLLSVRSLVRRLSTDWRFDCLHAHFSYPDGAVARYLARRHGVPYVITEHALWHGWMDKHPLVRRMAVHAVRGSALTVAASPAQRDSILRFADCPDRIEVIPNGVDGAVFRPSDNPARGSGHRIIFVGFLNINKGIDVLLKALRQLLDRGLDVRLVIVGRVHFAAAFKEQRKQLRLLDELGLQEQVDLAGPQAPARVADLIRESDVLVLPSHRESFGSVLVEALASGVPVVATRSGGPESIVTPEVGRLVRPGDPAALADGIAEVLEHRGRYDRSALRAYALRNFSWDVIARRLLEHYRRICRG